MAVVSKRTQIYTNPDNLTFWYFTEQAKASKVGTYQEAGSGRQVWDVIIRLTELPLVASGNHQIQDDTVVIPKGVQIETVEIKVLKVSVGASSTLNLGLVQQTDRTTALNFTGLLAASTTTWHTGVIGKTVVYRAGDTQAGALVGTVTTGAGLITADASTADFTDGIVQIRIYGTVPLTKDLT